MKINKEKLAVKIIKLQCIVGLALIFDAMFIYAIVK